MPVIHRGIDHNFAYSLSRWTDLPATKWPWFKERLTQGQMLGVDPRTGVPSLWSLRPNDTLGLVFWTRDPSNLVRDAGLLQAYKKVIHFTLTGWHEAESKSPSIEKGLSLMARACEAFGSENVTWRFSPIPTVPDVLERWASIAPRVAALGVRDVYVAFLQNNDLMVEPRDVPERAKLLVDMAKEVKNIGLTVQLCNEDRTLSLADSAFYRDHVTGTNLGYGICEDGSRFTEHSRTEGCGCALAVDPFTVTETCQFNCAYCYAADRSISTKKKSTTKPMVKLPVVG